MRITQFSAENVKRLSVVHIDPAGHVVVIAGENGAGKSSVLDAIMYALGGGRSLPSQPIRNGAKAAKVVLHLDGDEASGQVPLVVTRTFNAKGSEVTVKTETGYTEPSPQKLLDSLWNRVSYDPLGFVRLQPNEQVNKLRALVGLDFSKQDKERARLFDERTGVNREVTRLCAQLAEWGPDEPGTDATESTSVEELTQQLRTADSANQVRAKQQADLESSLANEDRLQDEIDSARAVLSRLELSLNKAKIDTTGLRQELADSADVDTAPILEQMERVEQNVAKQQKARARRVARAALVSAEADAAELTQLMSDIDLAKSKAMTHADWPVEGLGFDDEGVTLNYLPFKQASQAEQLRVAVSVGLGLNPKLRVLLIREASLLGEAAMEAVAQMAEEHDAQVWLERVGTGDECAIIIDDGAVVEVMTGPHAPGPRPEGE